MAAEWWRRDDAIGTHLVARPKESRACSRAPDFIGARRFVEKPAGRKCSGMSPKLNSELASAAIFGALERQDESKE
jgi:hypothetical protein